MSAGDFEPIARLLLGLIVLLAGRNVFWLTIAAVGFLMGFEFAGAWLSAQPTWVAVVAGLGCGLIGAVLAMLFERLGFALAGFFAAAFAVIELVPALGTGPAAPLLVFGAGLIGAVLTALLTDWAIIVLSALAGAAAIMSIIALTPPLRFAGMLALAVLGIAVQRALMLRGGHRG